MTAAIGYRAFSDFAPPLRRDDPLRAAINASYRPPEPAIVPAFAEAATLDTKTAAAVATTARKLIERLRANRETGGVQSLVQEFALSSREGVALMCLAEALLRIPDEATRDALIRDKIAGGDWKSHLGGGKSLFVNAATWGLVVTGKLTAADDGKDLGSVLTRLIARAGEPVIRRGVDAAMRLMGEQFVTGQTIAEALQRSRKTEKRGFSYSYDMLGEAATTAADAARYYRDYEQAIHAIGKASERRGVYRGPGISIKLSALHPRYVRSQADRVMDELLPKVRTLALIARSYDIGFNIDAEEADRLELSLDILQALAEDAELDGWNGLGFVIQAYQKRCPALVDWIVALARRTGKRIMVRLVKGAYWDAEIKRAQIDGLADFPVYTRKIYTDVAYIACAKKLLAARDAVFPQFATHNAQTLATVFHLAGPDFSIGDYEFQCLHGMGEGLYGEVVGKDKLDRPCRIYAPVGTHETLLAYLVRRLLENGANSSFVNRINDEAVPIDELIADPAAEVRAMPEPGAAHERIARSPDMFADRRNSAGIDLSDEAALAALADALVESTRREWVAGEASPTRTTAEVRNPADRRDLVGLVHQSTADDARNAVAIAAQTATTWAATPLETRTAAVERAADLLQERMPLLMGLVMREAGKSAPNAIAEIREAIDFLRYYPVQARAALAGAAPLGPVVCISPWNFPMAIFTGQVVAALVAGNPVVAKPSSETPLIAAQAVAILHEAGIPVDVLQLVPGDGSIGAALVAAPEAAGVVFTGSTGVARSIQKTLAGRTLPDGSPIPFVAETGGQNAMIVDSSALAEQVVADVIASAFDSAGQRCSALRLLCLQEDIADRTLDMLRGALAELRVGSTDRLAVDIGPVISARARDGINAHIDAMRAKGRRVEQVDIGEWDALGTFVAPTIIELQAISELEQEVFGPVLHVIRFKGDRLDALIADINATGYGLTFGLHTRLDEVVDRVTRQIAVGNHYVNRNIIGAVVGVQPFGGRGLSGTGPKAGGPIYVTRFAARADSVLPAASEPGSGYAAFADWAAANGNAEAQRAVNQYRGHSRLGLDIELPGPVGERNLYSLHPRGRIAMLAKSEAGFWNQIAAILATGNKAVILSGSVTIESSALPTAIAAHVERPRRDLRSVEGVSAALIEGDAAEVARATEILAERDGAIITLHAASTAAMGGGDPAYRLDLLLEEVTVSINTTAAGGNASLMAMV
ncbi:trifunctional transcriptional regulator/proline dehydrogenase/L-glutamate gamma-semialdehyde dehydrogenase [Sphingopyxis sp. P8]|uniref:trifunctional transcriptional regulator/proline dehydrogenase/L-glutamate gamma-semialdehyde dehydrogenase n=1 Tax=Sphingopyxis sp. P8 TaxID=2763256 RepID=UPI001D0A11E9|nr:trifunctional transcriptional regulator/proline dehydrogenase/L-glutamate gamma-semialdehyde dehydrogenase [Sphingopyxis sp. P8]